MRDCGPCRLCCILPALPSIGKLGHVPCKHLCDEGCKIYAKRPNACAKYRCMWLDGHFDEEDRPDKVGVICSTMTLYNVCDIIVVELQDDDQIPEQLVSSIVNDGWVIQFVKTDGSKYLHADKNVMKSFLEDARSAAR